MVGINGNLGFLPELLRVKGGVLLAMSAPDEAKICFTRSLELSRHQGALAWELRTGVDLATLLVSRGQAESARMLLRPVLDKFAEGLDTPDLKAAERLLAACG